MENIPTYLCSKCGQEHQFKPNDKIKCRSCGNNIFFKKRLRKPIMYDAI